MYTTIRFIVQERGFYSEVCLTVNHRVAGSSPAWGAIIEFPFRESLKRGFFVLKLVPFTSPILVKQTDWCYIFGFF